MTEIVDPQYWEGILERAGLGLRHLKLQDDPDENEVVQEPEKSPARRSSGNNPDFDKLRTKFDSNDSFIAGGHQIKKIRGRLKDAPGWATNNSETQKLLLLVFPKLKTNPLQRKRAARWAAVIHLYYRMGLTCTQIAVELRDKRFRVKSLLQRIRWAAKGLRTDHRGVRKTK